MSNLNKINTGVVLKNADKKLCSIQVSNTLCRELVCGRKSFLPNKEKKIKNLFALLTRLTRLLLYKTKMNFYGAFFCTFSFRVTK